MMQRHDHRPLSGVVGVSAKPHASTNIERDSLIGGYLPNTSAIRAIEVFSAGLGSGAAMSVVGPYGSGKSTFGVVLNGLAAPSGDAGWKAAYGMLRKTAPDTAGELADGRRRAGMHDIGMIRCIATARSEPVGATILRAAANGAASYFGASYRRSHFAEGRDASPVCQVAAKEDYSGRRDNIQDTSQHGGGRARPAGDRRVRQEH